MPRRRASPTPVAIPIPQSLQLKPFDWLEELLCSARALSVTSGGRETRLVGVTVSLRPNGCSAAYRSKTSLIASWVAEAASMTSGGRLTAASYTDSPLPNG